MSAQFGDQTSDVCAALTLLNAVPGRLGIQVGLQVFVTEAVEGMLASQDRREQVTICLSDRIESGVTLWLRLEAALWDSIEAHQASVKNISPEQLGEVRLLLAESPSGNYYNLIEER